MRTSGSAPLLRAAKALMAPLSRGRRLFCTRQGATASGLELSTGLFGKLTVSAPGRTVEVASLDPAQHDDMGRVLVPHGEASGLVRARQLGERNWIVEAAETSVGEKRPMRVLVPPPMDLCVSCGSGCGVSVVENRVIELTASSASSSGTAEFRFDRVKSGDVRVQSELGAASLSLSRTLFESLKAQCRLGIHLRASMYQGARVSLESPDGLVAMETQAIYCRTCSLRGSRVSFKAASAHGDFELEASEAGSVVLDSLEGGLQLRMLEGDIRMHLTRPRIVNIDLAEGSVQLGLQREVSGPGAQTTAPLLVDVTASEIDLDSELGDLIGESVFPLGPKAVRLVAEVPGCGGPAGEDAAPAECRVRLVSGKVRLGISDQSGLFTTAWAGAAKSAE